MPARQAISAQRRNRACPRWEQTRLARFVSGLLAVAIGATASARITLTPAIIAPERLSQIHVARIGCCTYNSTSHGTNRCTRDGVTGGRADGSTTCCTNHTAAQSAVTRPVTTSTQGQQASKSQHKHTSAHLRAPFYLEALTRRRS
jgi:hypothetical protein